MTRTETEQIEQLIVLGAERRDRGAAQALRRPTVEDLFAGESGLPEIQGGELTSTALASAVLHHGALLVHQLYDDDQLAILNELAAEREEVDREGHFPLGCSPTTLLRLLEVYESCGLLSAVSTYLDREPLLFAERAKLRQLRRGRDKFASIPWHQDVNFFGERVYSVNCWAAVTACGEANPGLGIIPRRTEERHGWRAEDGVAPLDYGREMPAEDLERLCDGCEIAEPVLAPGDALLFDEMTVHRTALKPWSQDSQVVTISWFFRPSGFPDWGTPLGV